jgi:dihydropteroate synthase
MTAPRSWICRNLVISLESAPLLMGIVNVTPDSFSDGGMHLSAGDAVKHGLKLAEEGADILDIGGESTRPGAEDVPAAEEAARVVPVIEELARLVKTPISIDTRKASVAAMAMDAGARIINDVSALTHDPAMPGLARDRGAGVVVMHMRGNPRTMQNAPEYDDVVEEVASYLGSRIDALEKQGLSREAICVDPGIGFGKTPEDNLDLLANLGRFRALGRPLLIGLSRKSFLGSLTRRPVGNRLAGSLAAAAWCVACGADILRVHDVAETADTRTVIKALASRAGAGVPRS